MKRSTASSERPWLGRETAARLLDARSCEELADLLARAMVAAGVQWCVAAVGRMHLVRVIAEYGPAPPIPGTLRVLSGGGQLSLELSPVYPAYVTSTEDIVLALIASEQNATTDLLWHVGRAMLEGLVQRQRCRALEIQLAQRTQMLETIFELVRDASVEMSRERLLHIAGLRLMAHAATSRVFIALFEGEEIAHRWSRGVVLDAAVGRALPRDLLVQRSSVEFSGELRMWLQAERIALLAPIALRERVLGVVGIGARSDGSQQQLDDAFLTAYLNALAVAIEQLALLERLVEQERIERELALARSVQQRLLPSLERMCKTGGAEIAARIEPARHVSGDYFDVIERNGSILCTIADVCGKGMAAALIMAHLHAAFHLLGSQHASPAEVLRQWNRLLVRHTEPGSFVTAAIIELDAQTRTLRYANAGHPYPFVLAPGGNAALLDRSGLVLGVVEDVHYEEHVLELLPGSIVCLYSDGISETQCLDATEFGIERLRQIIEENAAASLGGVVESIFGAVATLQAPEVTPDDRTVVLLRLAAS
jgi:serine phosphatase RsbU (regulator of sigma subunit)